MDSMQQVSAFSTSEKEAFKLLEPILISVVLENGLNPKYISYKKRKFYYSLMFDNTVIIRISNYPSPYFSTPRMINISNGKSAVEFSKIDLLDLGEIVYHTSTIKNILQLVIDKFPKEFDCCSRFRECSNALKCTHPDKEFALKCGYRKNLKNGKIFYGKNKII